MTAEMMMREALKEARLSGDDVPVGAVIAKDGTIIARAHNERETGRPFAHAEILAMERACAALGTRRLKGCTLYVTLEPCPLCAGGLILSGIDACVFGAYDEKQGCCGSVYCLPEDACFSHRVDCIGGVLEAECRALLTDFFQGKRAIAP